MAFRVELTARAQWGIAYIHEWLQGEQAGASRVRWFAALSEAIDLLQMRGVNYFRRSCCLTRECYRTASFDSYRPRRSFLRSGYSRSGAIRAQKRGWSSPDALRAGGLDGAPREGA